VPDAVDDGEVSGRTFGVLSPFVGGDYYGAIIAGINAAAVAAGDRIIGIQTLDPGSHSADRAGVPDFRRPVAWRHVAGLIVLAGAVDISYATAARAAGLPVAFVAQDATAAGCSAVLADSRTGVREAVAHLIGHGHHRIAFAGHLAHYDLQERHEGYREGMLSHGLAPPPDLLFNAADNHESGGAGVAAELLRAGMPATAIVVGTDRNALGLFAHLTAAGHSLPGDLAVVGFDDIPDATFLVPGLSTVRQPLDELGAAAYDLVAAPDDRARLRKVPTGFVRRDSCGCTGAGLPVSEHRTRSLFGQVQLLQDTLNIQYELSIDLLGTHDGDPRALDWLGRTPAVAGCLGLWQDDEPDAKLDIAGEFRIDGPAPAPLPAGEFPPERLFARAGGPAGDVVFLVPVRSRHRDWGMLAAVGPIQSTTPPGREMMNHSGALLAAALDYDVMMAALREQEESLRNAALHDHLTGLPNRVLLADRLAQAGMRAVRQPGYRYAVLLLDLDGFKAVNDTLGHAAGDQLLVEVARRLTGLLRRTDTVARLGGDEFVILVDGVPAPGGERAVRDSVAAALASPFVLDGRPVSVGLSIGVAISGPGAADPDHLLREADAAMYRAKADATAR
jgi:diguanylate cyclase (GGDEF)-like protein